MKYPALDVRGVDGGLVLALVDDCGPTAVEDLPDGISVFFPTPARRDEARGILLRARPEAVTSARDVDDEDWARRSQENLTAVTVGRITVAPPWASDGRAETAPAAGRNGLSITIAPSMGFGTGHHATTRLCLQALQQLDAAGRTVLDVGTGSGVLAIAAALLGAADSTGIDLDPDAIAAARESHSLNPAARPVRFDVADLRTALLPQADIVLANLTGASLIQGVAELTRAVRRPGHLIVSGLQGHERDEVLRAFGTHTVVWSAEEDGWVGVTLAVT